MNDGRPRFGFMSRAGQFGYPFLISAILLALLLARKDVPVIRSFIRSLDTSTHHSAEVGSLAKSQDLNMG